MLCTKWRKAVPVLIFGMMTKGKVICIKERFRQAGIRKRGDISIRDPGIENCLSDCRKLMNDIQDDLITIPNHLAGMTADALKKARLHHLEKLETLCKILNDLQKEEKNE